MKWLAFSVLLVFAHHTDAEITTLYNKYPLTDTFTKANYEDNTCSFPPTSMFDEVISVRYTQMKEDRVVGHWDEEQNLITLAGREGLTVGTVAHEVSHAVDSLMKKHRPDDEHYRAYLQGNLTECVYSIMIDDL